MSYAYLVVIPVCQVFLPLKAVLKDVFALVLINKSDKISSNYHFISKKIIHLKIRYIKYIDK